MALKTVLLSWKTLMTLMTHDTHDTLGWCETKDKKRTSIRKPQRKFRTFTDEQRHRKKMKKDLEVWEKFPIFAEQKPMKR